MQNRRGQRVRSLAIETAKRIEKRKCTFKPSITSYPTTYQNNPNTPNNSNNSNIDNNGFRSIESRLDNEDTNYVNRYNRDHIPIGWSERTSSSLQVHRNIENNTDNNTNNNNNNNNKDGSNYKNSSNNNNNNENNNSNSNTNSYSSSNNNNNNNLIDNDNYDDDDRSLNLIDRTYAPHVHTPMGNKGVNGCGVKERIDVTYDTRYRCVGCVFLCRIGCMYIYLYIHV